MSDFPEYIISCNGAPLKKYDSDAKYLELEYKEGIKKNVNIELNNFLTKVLHLKERYKDLLEIAGYIFAADRKSSRGKPEYLEQHSWSRSFHFHIKVRDYNFWNRPDVKSALSEALCFMTGDHRYEFTFYKAAPDFPSSLFDNEKLELNPAKNLSIVLFSGGLDSLAGVIERIETTDEQICLVSHQSGQPGVTRTQNQLFKAINNLYPDRCKHYKFHCGLSHTKSVDETQRTRAFLYSSTAFTIANTYKQKSIYVYENGITTINFAKTQDLMNGRASRTTHPKTLGLLEKLFEKISEDSFKINHPYFFKTKTDVFEVIKKYNKVNLLDSAVSCSRTRNHPANFTHCGVCSQCIDRIFASFAAGAEEYDDNGIYYLRFYKDNLEDDEVKKALIDYIRLANESANTNIDYFYKKRAYELVDIIEYLNDKTYEEGLERIFNLCQRHSKQIEHSIQRLSKLYDKPFSPRNPKSFFSLIIGMRAYQQDTRNIEVRSGEVRSGNGNEVNIATTLKPFRRGELQEILNKYITDMDLQMGVSVPNKKVQQITRKIIQDGWDGKENSIAETLRKMGYVEGKRK
ncbi:MAG: hypothetical protein Q7S39_06540 [Ignavibacteria bacterium]|nr:hypothetical protein [Ignavibacteria bacterium]